MATFADAQGTIQFANGASTRFRINGVIPANSSNGGPVGGTFSFGAFVGVTADALSSQPVGAICTNSSTGGLISGPNANAFQLPGFEPNTTVFIQIRVWETRFGSWQCGQAGFHAQTAVRSFVLGPASGPGTVIWSSTDPTKFQAIEQVGPGQLIPDPLDPCVPEPSTIALVTLGLVSLFLFRRRK